MRNALICAGVMLAMLLLWPVVFGGAGSPANASQTGHAASTVTMAVPAPVVRRPLAPAGQTCRRRHDVAAGSCSTDECRQRAADGWDICEATGLWPE